MFFERITLAAILFILAFLFSVFAQNDDAPGLIIVSTIPLTILGLACIYRAFRKPETKR